MNAKYYEMCKKDFNYSHVGNASAKKYLNIIDRAQYINNLLKGKKREKIVADDFLHQEDKSIYDDIYEKDEYSEDIFDKNYKNHHQKLLEEQKTKYLNFHKSCSNINLNSKKKVNYKDINAFNQEKFKYHMIHHLHDLSCDDTIYKRLGNEASCASYNPKFNAIYRKIIFSPKFGKMSGRYDMEIFEKKMENNLKRKKEQRLIEKMERLKKIKKILEKSEKRIDKNNKSREKKHSENKNSENKNLSENRHNSFCGDIFQINLFNTASSKNIKKNFKKSASMCVKTIDIDSIKENNETKNEIIEEEDDIDSSRKKDDIMKKIYSKSNENANNSCKNIKNNNGYYNELSTTNPKSSTGNLNQSAKNIKNIDLSYSNANTINNVDNVDVNCNISINYNEKKEYEINNNKNNISRNNNKNNFKENYDKIKNSKTNSNSSLQNTKSKNRSCSNINNSNNSSKKKNCLPLITAKNIVDFSKMLSRDYVDKINSPPKQKIYTIVTPNYEAIRPKEVMKVIYSRKNCHKRKNKIFKSDFNETVFDINKYFNNYNNHFPPKNIYFYKMTGKETSNENSLPSYMIKQFNRNAINTFNDKGLLMNSFANGKLKENKSSFNEKKSFNYRLNGQLHNDNSKNLSYEVFDNILNNAVREENRKMVFSHSMCELDSNGKKRLKKFCHLRGIPEYYKVNLDNLGKLREKVDGITLKVNKINVNINDLLTDSEKNIFLSDLKCD